MGIESKTTDFDNQLRHQIVNGIEFFLGGDDKVGYTLIFPQVDPAIDPLDPIEKTIKIGKNPDHSKKIIEFTKQLAQTMTNADQICRTVGNYAKTLNLDLSMETHVTQARVKVGLFARILGKLK